MPVERESIPLRDIVHLLAISLDNMKNQLDTLSARGINPDLDEGRVEAHEVDYPELRMFAENGDWDSAEILIDTYPDALRATFTGYSYTALHIAANAKKWEFVERLLDRMGEHPEDLELKETKSGYTALHTVIVGGNIEYARRMVNMNPGLTQICDKDGSVPLKLAADYVTNRQKEMLEYLWSVTGYDGPSKPFSGPRGASLLCSLIDANFYDNAMGVLVHNNMDPNIGIEKEKTAPLRHWKSWQGCHIYFSVDARKNGFGGAGSTRYVLLIVIQVRDALPVRVPDALADEEIPENDAPDDVENPPDVFPVGAGNPAVAIVPLPPTIPNPYARVPIVKGIYDKKLMHKKVTDLLKDMLTQLKDSRDGETFFESSDVLNTALKSGTTEFVVECLRAFPGLIWLKKVKILQMAVEERNDEVLKLICELSEDLKDDLVSRKDENGNHILHHVAKLPASHHLNSVLGAPLQMQREMQWFTGVENLLPEKYRLARNNAGETALQIFSEAHKPLVVEAEKWMKGTSESCMLVTTLIATVTFAAAITVPGGNTSGDSTSGNNGTPSPAPSPSSIAGIPMFLHMDAFMVFAITDGLSLFFSITSVLIFLSILTSRYAEVDFLVKLPTKLILGLFTLFVSIVTLMVAFGAALYVVLGQKIAFWAPIPVACFPVITLLMQFTLFKEIVLSTCRRNIFRRHKHRSVKLKAV